MSAQNAEIEGLVHALTPLGSLSEASQAQVLNTSEVLHFPRGAFVFREGERDNYSFYLLEGRLELVSGGQTVQRVVGGTPDASCALAQLQPRKMSAKAESEVAVLRVNRDLVEKLLAADVAAGDDAIQVDDIDTAEQDDWMTRMLQSELFAKLPASNIHRIFSRLETVDVKRDEVVVRQDEPGDYYYVIVSGRAEVARSAGPRAPSYRLALIGAGDAFGEEALVGDAPRNASVRMLTDGQLVRLGKEDFIDLIRTPLLNAVDYETASNLVSVRNAQWLDVRFPEEHRAGAIENSLNHPVNTLRMHSGRLDPGRPYIVYCDGGARSAIAAFLLAERGFDVHVLAGGMPRSGGGEAAVDLSLSDDEKTSLEPRGPAPVPASQRLDDERSDASAVAAGNATVKLAVAEVALAEVAASVGAPRVAAPDMREIEARAREAAEQAAEERLAAERARAREELEQARQEAAAAAQARLEEERQAIEAAKREAREQAQAELAKARAEAEAAAQARLEKEREAIEAERQKAREDARRAAATRLAAERKRLEDEARKAREQAAREAEAHLAAERARLADEADRARRELEEARELKAELERARDAAQAEVERERAEQSQRVEQVRAEMERRLREEEAKIKESYAWQAEELKRLQAQKRDAEVRLKEEQARLQQQAEEARARLAESREFQKRLEEVEQASAAEAALREQQRLELERRLRDELKDKVQSERQALESELARNAAQLARAQQELRAAEAARRAAADEAQQIVADFKSAHARKRMQEEAEMQAERARLEGEANRLRLALELAQREKDIALAEQQRAEAELDDARSDGQRSGIELERLKAQADEAARQVAESEQARADAQAAAVASAGDLAAHRVHEDQVRTQLKSELEEWVREQSDFENSDVQQSILANQKAHVERLKQRAAAARAAAKAHDRALIDELAERLRGDDEEDD
ncbi:MAG: cyclic nucleotide-binding domain-containing protein [Gammaproteobacteria bacterium]|nr:cyclic nucleotide-binding domain-containing protein [Gammaproteobacteria bacterium]MCP5199433.1 cyclic nucleotide-binding domain-containing protein [Gammaproteobacteria bacterium]